MKKNKVEVKATVEYCGYEIELEFGRVQAKMSFSGRGTLARKLKLKEDDKVKITIEKV